MKFLPLTFADNARSDIFSLMKTDIYTKVILTAIAVMLGVIATNQFAHPVAAAAAAEQIGFALGQGGYYYVYQDGSKTVTMFGDDGHKFREFHLQ